ncbi:MAG: glycine cleavage system protein T, partial [Acidimicrobiia bacterium]|nr:glycine cleavage system protein T [Acidimicrobiia bacterium]
MPQSPIHSYHQELGARFVDFGGWEMPLSYGSALTEHRAVREGAGWFDVSHLGRFSWEGAGWAPALSRLLCNDHERIGPGRAQYTMILNSRGGVIDDLIIWKRTPDEVTVMP